LKEVIIDIETTGLNPLDKDARVVCIGIKCADYEEVLMSNREEALLTKFWGLPFFEGYFRVLGFNCIEFDLYYLLVRTFKYGIRIPDIKGKVIDLRLVLSYGNRFKNGKLEDYTTLFLGEKGKKKDYSGADVKTLWESGKYEELKQYCLYDVLLTYKIYERLKQMEVL